MPGTGGAPHGAGSLVHPVFRYPLRGVKLTLLLFLMEDLPRMLCDISATSQKWLLATVVVLQLWWCQNCLGNVVAGQGLDSVLLQFMGL